jgi:hypothetical protein
LVKPKDKTYSIDYFIELFTEVDDDMLCLVKDSHVASSYDGWDLLLPEEQDSLYQLIRPYGIFVHVNDGVGQYANLGKTIKQRILTFLLYVKQHKICVY